jgi:hypothetical protein
MNISIATAAGSAAKPTEDWAGATTSAAVVLDGVTAPADLGTGCIHTTPWYVHHLGTQLLQLAGADESVGLTAVLTRAIADVAALHSDTCDLGHPGTPSATVAMLRENPNTGTADYLVLSDAVAVLDDGANLTVVSDQRVDQVASAERAAARSQQFGAPGRSDLMRRLVTKQRQHRNRENGYWVAGADPEAAPHAITGTCIIRRAALMTDGAAALVSDYEITDWSGLLDLLDATGPTALIRRVRRVEESDPTGMRWPRYKASDDATAIYLAPDIPERVAPSETALNLRNCQPTDPQKG